MGKEYLSGAHLVHRRAFEGRKKGGGRRILGPARPLESGGKKKKGNGARDRKREKEADAVRSACFNVFSAMPLRKKEGKGGIVHFSAFFSPRKKKKEGGI